MQAWWQLYSTETPTQVFSQKYSDIFKNNLLIEHHWWFLLKDRCSCPEVVCKKGVLGNFTKITGKHLCQSLFLEANYFQKQPPEVLWKKRSSEKFCKFLGKHLSRVSFLIKLHAGGLQLYQKRDHGTGILQWILQNFSEYLFLQNTSIGYFWK